MSSAQNPDPNPSTSELDKEIAAVRENLRDLVEQAAAYSGAGDEEHASTRIAEQEARLAELLKLRGSRSTA